MKYLYLLFICFAVGCKKTAPLAANDFPGVYTGTYFTTIGGQVSSQSASTTITAGSSPESLFIKDNLGHNFQIKLTNLVDVGTYNFVGVGLLNSIASLTTGYFTTCGFDYRADYYSTNNVKVSLLSHSCSK